MAKYFVKLMIDTKSEVQEAQRTRQDNPPKETNDRKNT